MTRLRQRLRFPSPATSQDAALALLLILTWLLPVAYMGSFTRPLYPWLPGWLNSTYAIGWLFGEAAHSHFTLHFQVRLEDERGFREPPLEGYFKHEPFGHLTRLDMI